MHNHIERTSDLARAVHVLWTGLIGVSSAKSEEFALRGILAFRWYVPKSPPGPTASQLNLDKQVGLKDTNFFCPHLFENVCVALPGSRIKVR